MRLYDKWQWKWGWKSKIEYVDTNYTNRPRPRHGRKYTKYKICLRIMMVLCVKEHLSNICSSIQDKIKQHSGWV